MKKCYILAVAVLMSLLLMPTSASAYLVGPAPTLKQTATEADVVLKVQAISSHDAQDSWLGTMPDMSVEETRLRVISALKGSSACSVILFRHYRALRVTGRSIIVSGGPVPICYQFEPGRAYLLFAKADGDEGTYRQIWKYPPGFGSDQGVLRCADAKLLDTEDLHLAAWHELTGLLLSARFEDKIYAVQQLDARSGDPQTLMATDEFDRSHVLAACAPLLRDKNPAVVTAAITVNAKHSPFLRDEYGTNWSPRRYVRPEFKSSLPPSPARIAVDYAYSRQLLSLADDSPDIGVRALAIRALGAAGLSDVGSLPSLPVSAARWANDVHPEIRTAAALRLGGDSSPTGQALLQRLSQDPVPSVRRATARGIGLAQNTAELALLSGLLHDADLDVREAAASSLASFPAMQAQAVLLADKNSPEFKSIFVAVLAVDNPEPYVDDLTEIISKQLAPPQFSGNLPDYEAWDILFKFLSSKPQASWSSSGWTHEMDVLDAAIAWDGTAPTELYTFYVSHSLTSRAARLRQSAKKLVSWDMENNFNNIDAETPVQPQSP